mmetsp:Transcript_9006/g.23298  ORF Transcript_9006/g.23298 Transcript_9006/m.23298 type:complete len:272 (+) Transcript_9006:2405-3220(+)
METISSSLAFTPRSVKSSVCRKCSPKQGLFGTSFERLSASSAALRFRLPEAVLGAGFVARPRPRRGAGVRDEEEVRAWDAFFVFFGDTPATRKSGMPRSYSSRKACPAGSTRLVRSGAVPRMMHVSRSRSHFASGSAGSSLRLTVDSHARNCASHSCCRASSSAARRAACALAASAWTTTAAACPLRSASTRLLRPFTSATRRLHTSLCVPQHARWQSWSQKKVNSHWPQTLKASSRPHQAQTLFAGFWSSKSSPSSTTVIASCAPRGRAT